MLILCRPRPLILLIFIFLHFCKGSISEHTKATISRQNVESNQIDNLAGTLLISTLDGYLTAIDAQTGADKWRFKEGSLLESPVNNVQRGFTFIPDPRDGQLYFVVEGQLSKLPFTIPHLVRVSPCKSSDGVFYAGNKKDVWISVNPDTGERMDPFTASATHASCPASHAQAVHIGKTEYHIQMVDTKQKDRHWNATFVDYSSHLLPEDTDYPFQHFTSSADGRVLTVDASTGFVLWQRDFVNVIVNMYLLKGDGMHRLPSTAIGQETFELLVQSTALNPLLHAPAQLPNRLLPTLYVGESPHVGLYALPAFVDERTNRIAPKYLGPPLLEGPKEDGTPSHLPTDQRRQILPPDTVGPTYTTKDGEFLILGYHEMPKALPGRGDIFSTALPAQPNVPLIAFKQQEKSVAQRKLGALAKDNGVDRILPTDFQQNAFPEGFLSDVLSFAQKHPYEVSAVAIFMIAMIIVSSWLLGRQSELMRRRTLSSGSSLAAGTDIVGDASRSSRGSVYTAYEPDELPLGWHRVNSSSLSYNSGEVLGRGCEGTIVYIGKFDDRRVAVKRIVSANLDSAVRQQIEREVMHLRQSDSHPNVIRYFCSETDRHFHYIALELCNMTLEDLIRMKMKEGSEKMTKREKLDLMKQTAGGIAHLHHIHIVHRDVKPKNILLTGIETGTKDDHQQQIRSPPPRICVKISDFGLCKSVKLGHNSISRVSGIVGTEGWMAPELLNSDSSITYAIDVFSLGCVFYYMLSDGQHPFGESLSRMNNIKFGISSLNSLDEHSDHISRSLIEAMIRSDAKQRPTASAVEAHPIFWEPAKALQFLTEVSDWIEKKDMKDPVMRRLEWRRDKVIGNWLDKVDELLKLDLIKQRPYMNNMRDLLRAIRNKKHHFQELSPELRALLGQVPNEYLAYFTGRLPKLLMHVFMAISPMGKESIFHDYYQPEKLREFYEQERANLFRLEPERRSASPVNWRATNQKIMAPTQNQLSISTMATFPNYQNILPPFDPSIPPPLASIIPVVAPVQLDQPSPSQYQSSQQKELQLELQEDFTTPTNAAPLATVVAAIQSKTSKPKKSKRKKRKAPFSVLTSNVDEEEEEEQKKAVVREDDDEELDEPDGQREEDATESRNHAKEKNDKDE